MGAIDPRAYADWYDEVARAHAPAAPTPVTRPAAAVPTPRIVKPDDGRPLRIGVSSFQSPPISPRYATSALPPPKFLTFNCPSQPDLHCPATSHGDPCNYRNALPGGSHVMPVRQTLYDVQTLMRGPLWQRFFIETAGRDHGHPIHPGITTGGQLSAPRTFEIHRIRCWYQPLVDFHPSGSTAERQVRMRRSIDACTRGCTGRLSVGLHDYWEGPLHTLPFRFDATPIFLPSEQVFRFTIEGVHDPMSSDMLRVTVGLEGYFGWEVA